MITLGRNAESEGGDYYVTVATRALVGLVEYRRLVMGCSGRELEDIPVARLASWRPKLELLD